MTNRIDTPSPASPRQRLSNLELLRMISMMMVLILHADYAALGVPKDDLLTEDPLGAVSRVVWEQIAIVGVNVFVLISGWFGIRTSLKGVCSLLFQVIFYALAVIAVFAAAGWLTPNDYHAALMSLIPGYDHWFIRSYLGLMILVPVINAYLRQASMRQLAAVVTAFFIFQTIYGWILGKDGFSGGYSLLSFIGIYMLGHLARRGEWHRRGPWLWLALYLGCVAIDSAASLWRLGATGAIPPMIIEYNSPVVILGALSLMLTFAALPEWRSRTINGMAASCLAVYLLHFNPLILKHYLRTCFEIYCSYYPLISYPLLALFLLAVFFASILVARLRLIAWRPLSRLPILTRQINLN